MRARARSLPPGDSESSSGASDFRRRRCRRLAPPTNRRPTIVARHCKAADAIDHVDRRDERAEGAAAAAAAAAPGRAQVAGEDNSSRLRRQTASRAWPKSRQVSAGAAKRRVAPRAAPVAPAATQPKLVQWSKEPLQYYEGSTLVLSCSSASASAANAPLKFTWLKSAKALMQAATGNAASAAANTHERLSIETLAEYSFLRLASLQPSDAGQYTCVASNALGQEDRTSVQVIVNGK